MKRILHAIRSADPAGGGPIEVVMRLGLQHMLSGRTVEIVTLDSPDAPWVNGSPIPIHALGPVTTRYGYTSRLLPWLREHAPSFDVVVVNGIWQYTSLAVRQALRDSATPYVVFPHGMLDPWFKKRYPIKHVKKWLYWPWAEYRVLRDAALVLFTSEEERRTARQSFWLYKARETVISYGTSVPPDETPTERTRFFERFPQLTGKRLLLFFGRIHEKKGGDLLIRAFASARSAMPSSKPWHLVFAGPAATAGYQRKLERLIADQKVSAHVTWTGMLTGDMKWAGIRAAEVFALPSHQENFGVAVVEALACGIPVLISTKVNIWREILASEAGLVEPDDQVGTTRLLMRWMALDPAVQSRMRYRAAQCFATQFDMRDTAGRLMVVLERLR